MHAQVSGERYQSHVCSAGSTAQAKGHTRGLQSRRCRYSRGVAATPRRAILWVARTFAEEVGDPRH